MSISKLNCAPLFFLLIFSFRSSYCLNNNGVVCPDIEKNSLLTFKRSLEDLYGRLSSWEGDVDCCKWKGVICSNTTGHVRQLRLPGSYSTQFEVVQVLSGKVNPSLIHLKHLNYLDLSFNDFAEERIPSFFGSFKNLEYLILSEAGFHGKIPHNIGNLSKLHTLDLYNLGVYADSLEWLSGLSQLEYLDMSYVNLSRATIWPQVINALPSLRQLLFSMCDLNSSMDISLDNVNISTSLTHLDVSYNDNFIAIPSWFFRLANLQSIDLTSSYFIGPIPTFSNATKLRSIDLSVNYFINSTIPDWLYLCKELELVSLNGNLLQGKISSAIGNLTSLTILDLSDNKFSGIPREITNLCRIREMYFMYNELQGEVSDSFGDMSECFLGSLEVLYLQSNNLSGHLTDQFGEFKSLRILDLGNNSLSGGIPVSIGKLSSLEKLYINDNMITGIVTESHFANLTKLKELWASMNHITLNVGKNWTPNFQLEALRIGSWNLRDSHMPSWLEKQKNVAELDLSNTGIAGRVPHWFRWNITSLDLSHNHLIGEIPENVGSVYMYLNSNRFSGPLPRIVGSNELDLSNNSFSGHISPFLCGCDGLEFLNLGENQLTGELPDCWIRHSGLMYLNIGNNNISGGIPNSIGFLADLQSLNLNGNRISGPIPFSMQNCSNLLKIDLAHNDLDGSIPTWMGTSLSFLRVLMLSSNKMSGKISLEICHLNYLQILDLSDNQFSGVIPNCFYNLTAMATKRSLEKNDYHPGSVYLSDFSYSFERDVSDSASLSTKGTILQYNTILSLVTNIDLSKNKLSGDIPKELTTLVELRFLNLSENHLTGLIPDNIGNMKQLESLDFSRTSLSGQIPSSFALLSSLAYLNLSDNNLSGRIPESTQLQSFNATSFTGNNLCGPPLMSKCSHDDDGVRGQKDKNEGDDESTIEWLYVFLSLGYVVGVSAVYTTLVLKESWRRSYFEFLDREWDKFYMYVYINCARLQDHQVQVLDQGNVSTSSEGLQ